MADGARRALPGHARAWALYDFANSAYALLVGGVAFQLYFKRVAFAGSPHADLVWALALGAAVVLAGLLSPGLGVAADRHGVRRPAFAVATLAAIAGTAALGALPPGRGLALAVTFAACHLAYNLALFLYDSWLPAVAPSGRTAELSGLAWGLGFAGGIACLAITWPLFSGEPSPAATRGFRLGFVAVAGFYLVFALPALVLLREPATAGTARSCAALVESYRAVLDTLRGWRQHRALFRFLAAFYLVTEAVMTALYFTANYLSTTFGWPARRILLVTLAVQAVAFPATWLAGRLAAAAGTRRLLRATVAVWAAVVVLLAAARGPAALYLAAFLMALVIGSTQALGRAELAVLVPAGRTGEFFGLNALSGKLAATLGPLLFGLVSSATASQRLAWLSLLPFLAAGAWLLRPGSDAR